VDVSETMAPLYPETVTPDFLSYHPKHGWRVVRTKPTPEGIAPILMDPLEGEERITVKEVRRLLGHLLTGHLTPRQIRKLLTSEGAELLPGGKLMLGATDAMLLCAKLPGLPGEDPQPEPLESHPEE
jgi:hypothetical protein